MRRCKMWLCVALVLVLVAALFGCGGNGAKGSTVEFIVDGKVYERIEAFGGEGDLPSDPVLQCKKFVGWYYDVAGEVRFDPAAALDSDVRVYAIFEENHNYSYVIKNPTCTDSGYTVYTCRDCSASYVADYTELIGHSYSEQRFEPTCEADGKIFYICGCGHSYSVSIKSPGHRYVETVVSPTYTSEGYTRHTCFGCGDFYFTDFVEPIAHEHIISSVVTAPSCMLGGYTTYSCSLCDHSYQDDHTAAIGHNYIPEVVPPTTEEGGYTVFTCDRCGDAYIGDYTDKHQHAYVTTVIAPTCTQQGYTVYTCGECDYSYQDDFVPTVDHDYTETVTPPTCTQQGYTHFECKRCVAEYYGDYTDPTDHNYSLSVTAPTCTEFGYTDYSCTKCDYTYRGNYTSPTEHPYISTVVEPNCYSAGYTIYDCPACGDSITGDYLPPLDHDIKERVIEPTCKGGGHTEYYCTRCDYINTDNYTSPLDHEMVWKYDSEYHWLACDGCGLNPDPEGPYRHSSANCECGYVAPVGTLMYWDRADGGWSVIDYQGSYEDPIDLYIPGTYRGGTVHFSLSSIRDDVRSLTIAEGVVVFDYVSDSESLEELILYCDFAESELYTFNLAEMHLKKLVLPKRITTFYLANCEIGELHIPNTVNNARIPHETSIGKVYYNGEAQDWLGFDYTVSDLLACAEELYLNGELVENLVIPEGVTRLNENIFCGVKTLKTLTLPTTLESIGKGAFSGCTSLSAVNFAEGLDTIECYAFRDCVALTEITLPKGLVSIHAGLFLGCTGLRYVYIPESLVNIGTSFNCNCSRLIGSSILSESSNAVLLLGGDSASLAADLRITETYLPYEGFRVSSTVVRTFNTYYNAVPEQYFEDENFGFVMSGEGTADIVHYLGDDERVIIPDAVEHLGTKLKVIRISKYAFMNKAVTDIHISKSITDIGTLGTDTVKNITVDNDNTAFTVVDNVLFSHDMTELILYPSGREGTYYEIPESVQLIISHAFVNPVSLEYVYMSNAEVIGVESFVSNKNIVVATPNHKALNGASYNYGNVTVSTEGKNKMGYISVGGLNYLTVENYAAVVSYSGGDSELTIPRTVSYGGKEYNVIGIFSGAFYHADTLTVVTVEQGIRVVGSTSLNGRVPSDYIFDGSFYYDPRGVWDITNMHAFKDCDNLEKIILPDTITDIMGLVNDCDSLLEVDFGKGVEYIAFGIENCDSIRSVVIPPSVKTMELYSIHNCSSLEYLSIGTVGMTERNESPTMTIYTWAIYECNNIKTLIIGDQVGKIEGRIPESVEILYAGTGFTIYSNTVEKISGDYKELHFWGNLSDFIEYTEWYCTSEHLYLKGELVSGDLVIDDEIGGRISRRMSKNLDITRIVITTDNTVIEPDQFAYCYNLYEIVVRASGVSFGYNACPYVTSLVLEEPITVGDRPFATIKKVSVKDIETLMGIEYSSQDLNPIFSSETVLYIIGSDTPCYEIVIPDSITVIEKNALCGLDFDKFTVIFHKNVTKIEPGAFVWNGTAYFGESIEGVVYGEWYYAYCDDASLAQLYVDPDKSLSAAMLSFDCYWFKLS